MVSTTNRKNAKRKTLMLKTPNRNESIPMGIDASSSVGRLRFQADLPFSYPIAYAIEPRRFSVNKSYPFRIDANPLVAILDDASNHDGWTARPRRLPSPLDLGRLVF